MWSQIDRQVMSDAVILPGVYARALLYRSPHLTNVYVHQYYGCTTTPTWASNKPPSF